ncbi:hypothetical protein ACHAXS_013925 [Conticribra weissflogii]
MATSDTPTIFKSWIQSCINTIGSEAGPNDFPSSGRTQMNDAVSHRLRHDARLHFEALSSSAFDDGDARNIGAAQAKSEVNPLRNQQSTAAQDVSSASSGNANGALAILVSTFGPVLSSGSAVATNDGLKALSRKSHRLVARARALHCFLGALEGSGSLTHGVREAVGRFLVEICKFGGTEDGNVDPDGGEDLMESERLEFVDSADLSPEEITQQLKSMDEAEQQKNEALSPPIVTVNADDIRDISMICLAALLCSSLDIFPTRESKSTESPPLEKAIEVVYQSMHLRLELAVLGLRNRCDMGDSDSINASSGAGYESMQIDFSVEEGLSQLPRAKRSICFNLLEGALEGIEKDASKWKALLSQSESETSSFCNLIPASVLGKMSSFVSLIASCLHGETDPRCLLQLLRLLNRTQQVVLPLFESHNVGCSIGSDIDVDESHLIGKIGFPSVDIFDAVAPYYPVHFTPPKNDPHGITRDLLQYSLMSVLCERGAKYDNIPINEKNGEDETMITLSGRMFLERLDPPKTVMDYEPVSSGSDSDVEDKLDAIRDLSVLLLPSSSEDANPNIRRVTTAFLTELSSSLARVHEESVTSATGSPTTDNETSRGSDAKDQSSLASSVRQFSSKLAYSLEGYRPNSVESGLKRSEQNIATTDLSLWEAFVVDIIRRLSPTLGSAPQGSHGRASTAYLASLAAGGGLITLNKVLQSCIPCFLSVLELLNDDRKLSSAFAQSGSAKNRDEDKMAAAMRGIAALVSSCRVTLGRLERERRGVQINPHPLLLYASSIIQMISSVLNSVAKDGSDNQLSLAAVAALESLLTSADLQTLNKENVNSMIKSFSTLSNFIIHSDHAVTTTSSSDQWKTACARALGALIARVFVDDSSGLANECNDLDVYAGSLLRQTLSSASSPPNTTFNTNCNRYDWTVLAAACSNGPMSVSRRIVSDICSKIIEELRSNPASKDSIDFIPVTALSYLVRNGGMNVSISFHEQEGRQSSSFTIIEELCKPFKCKSTTDGVAKGERDMQIPVGMSQLKLPSSQAGDMEEANAVIRRANLFLPHLLPAYEHTSAISSLRTLVNSVGQVIPPLSEWDEVKLSVCLPLLAAVLGCCDRAWSKLDATTVDGLKSMIPYLAQFCMNPDHGLYARSSASSCLFSTIFHYSNEERCDDDGFAVVHNLLDNDVFPALEEAIESLKADMSDDATKEKSSFLFVSSFSRIEDILNFMSVLGSAAECKGGLYARLGDSIASFLVELTCTNMAKFSSDRESIELISFTEDGRENPLMNASSHISILTASAFGNMLSVYNGSPFWRQRIAHKTLPTILRALHEQSQSQHPPALGTLAIICHMLCCLPVSILGKSNVRQFVPTLVAGLVYYSKNTSILVESEMISPKAAELLPIVIASLAKLLSNSPDDLTKFMGIIIPSFSLLCASKISKDYIPIQVLVLQCLELATKHPHARNTILREKGQVVAVLSALVDHPSSIIRHTAVQVRNVWYSTL